MAINPFGEASDSIHAWKSRYAQIEKEKSIIQQSLTEFRFKFEQKLEEFDQLVLQYQQMEEELSRTKQELRTFSELAKERAREIDALNKQMSFGVVEKLQNENRALKAKVDELIMEISRGRAEVQKPVKKGPNAEKLYNALIPVILYEYDESNEDYADSFQNLIEVSIEEGDILTQIVAILFKYGGSGPIDRIRDMVRDKSAYDTAIEILAEEQIVSVIDGELSIYVKGEDLSDISNWVSLSMADLVDQLAQTVERAKIPDVLKALEIFRDILTDRGSPVATIFFEIRKLYEGISKSRMTRKEALEKIEIWRNKLVR